MLVVEVLERLNDGGESMVYIAKMLELSHGKVVKTRLEKLGCIKVGDKWELGEGIDQDVLLQELVFKSSTSKVNEVQKNDSPPKLHTPQKPPEADTNVLSKEDIQTLKEMIQAYREGASEEENKLSIYDHLLSLERTNDKVKRTPMLESKVADKLDWMSDRYRISKEDVFMIAINLMWDLYGSNE